MLPDTEPQRGIFKAWRSCAIGGHAATEIGCVSGMMGCLVRLDLIQPAKAGSAGMETFGLP